MLQLFIEIADLIVGPASVYVCGHTEVVIGSHAGCIFWAFTPETMRKKRLKSSCFFVDHKVSYEKYINN